MSLQIVREKGASVKRAVKRAASAWAIIASGTRRGVEVVEVVKVAKA
jgi:hypothetical protein